MDVSPQGPVSRQYTDELTMLYQFSNTLLSTIRLNKLIHLMLSALTSSSTNLFERALLFLKNEQNVTLQGMLGLCREDQDELEIIGDDDLLGSRWDINNEQMERQRQTACATLARTIRLNPPATCLLVQRVITEQRLYISEQDACTVCETCQAIAALGVDRFVAAPLISGKKVIGLVIVDNHLSGATMKETDLHLLRLVCNQAGMAIDNSRLYDSLEKAHTELSAARQQISHGERLAAIGEMAANLAHELKNPLITIGGFAGRLLRVLPHDTREHQYADTIVQEISRLEKMLADILAFSRKPTTCYHPCDLKLILEESLASCSTTLEDCHIRLKSPENCSQCSVQADSHQLRQLFLNLLLNACEAMPDGGTLTIRMEKSILDKPVAVISIQDTGGGIPEDILTQIFNPFFTTKPQGTGLGLAIAYRIVQNHHGSIEATNEQGGALFRITLPLSAEP